LKLSSRLSLARWLILSVAGLFGNYTAGGKEATKTYHYKVETLHPTAPKHFRTIDEAAREADQQVLLRAKDGFRFLFTFDYTKQEPSWHTRFEVMLPAGEIQPLP
jgi:hypothetical protein